MANNRDWIRETLAHKQTQAVPYNFMFTPPAQLSLEKYYNQTDLEQVLKLPIRMSAPVSIKPLFADPAQFGEAIKDEFGVTWSTSCIDRGSPIGPCLAEPDLSNYTFPDAAEAYRFQGLEDWCERSKDNCTIIWVGDLWERATFMRGMEHILTDLSVNPKFVEGLLRGLTDYILQTMHILFDSFTFDGVALSDDYGTQKAMIMSPSHWRRLVKPLLAELYMFARQHGRTVFHHSCGNICPIIPDLIDIGLDILHPIQPEAMDILKLKREFGRDLTFCGGIRTQDLLPRGTVQQVRDEVKKLKCQMGKDGGYILEPGITIQADVPLENIVAMIEEARKVD